MKNTQFSTRLRRRKQFRQKTLNNLVLFFTVLIPIYPVFGSYMQDYTGAIVRGEYDRSTIIDAYDGTTGEGTFDILEIVDNPDISEPIAVIPEPQPIAPSPLPPNPAEKPDLVDKKRPLYMTHTVVRGDTIGTIAQKYGISVDTLRTTNNLSGNLISLNQKLVIPRINGVKYTIKKGDTLSTIAQKYGVANTQNILIANDMQTGSVLSVGKTLLLPNPTKNPDKVVVKKPEPKKPAIPPRTVPASTKKVTPKKDTPNNTQPISYG